MPSAVSPWGTCPSDEMVLEPRSISLSDMPGLGRFPLWSFPAATSTTATMAAVHRPIWAIFRQFPAGGAGAAAGGVWGSAALRTGPGAAGA